MSIMSEVTYVEQHAECLVTNEELQQAISIMAQNINTQLVDTYPVVLTVMVGGLVTMGQLALHLRVPHQMDYLHASRYQGNLEGKTLEWRVKPTISLKDRTVLIVDDVLDYGITLKSIVDYCYQQQAKQVYTAVLVEKLHEQPRSNNAVNKADFTGVTVPNKYIFGYGLDYKGYLRNAPGIFAIPEHT
ncbi:MAG: hypoxanthine-guanine phosphoribosyltransferase [Gammaproteobacteria bacterium]